MLSAKIFKYSPPTFQYPQKYVLAALNQLKIVKKPGLIALSMTPEIDKTDFQQILLVSKIGLLTNYSRDFLVM